MQRADGTVPTRTAVEVESGVIIDALLSRAADDCRSQNAAQTKEGIAADVATEDSCQEVS